MPVLFALTLFVSASLLFLIQPMIAKMILPLAGGTAAVWSTCMVFFQTALLGGYWYAHAGPQRFGARQFARPHSLLIILPLIALALGAWFGSPLSPIKSLAPHGEEYPFFTLVLLLAALVGLPFFFLATSAPLLQRWFAETDSPHANDPYFLYAASNLGSLLGLIAYPALIERHLRLSQQAWLFAAGFVLWALLTWWCAAAISRARMTTKAQAHEAGPPIPIVERLHWLILAAVPSSLMLSVTSHATVDLAPIPLFIVVPLGLYLLTFVIAFSRPGAWLGQLMCIVAPVALLLLIFMRASEVNQPKNLVVAISIHAGVFFLTALACHLELARRRPHPGRLTEYFLWISLGGVLGGLFNALIAPVIFTEHSEYTIGLIAACFVVTRSRANEVKPPISHVLDVAVPIILGCVVFMLVRFWPMITQPILDLVINDEPKKTVSDWLANGGMFLREDQIKSIVCFGIPILVSFSFVDRPIRFGLCIAAICLASYMNLDTRGIELRSRSFFGVLQVTQVPAEPQPMESVYHKLVHGTTLHGMQQIEPPSGEPLTYYHKLGPVGDIFAATPAGKSNQPIAIIGLGTGSLLSYAKPEQQVTVYEIDPAVRRIATNPKYFTYYTDAEERGAKISVEMGDARLRIEEAAPNSYALIAVDAFSSDSIPIHLLTREAIQLYLSKLQPHGVLALHVSNRYLDLDSVVARIAADLGKPAYHWKDAEEITDGNCPLKSRSDWVVIVNHPEDAGELLKLTMHDANPKWTPMKVNDTAPLWTDDFSNILGVLDWGQ